MWFLSPSGWPLYATGSLLADRLTAQGWTVLDPSQVQAAIDAYGGGSPLPPAEFVEFWAPGVAVSAGEVRMSAAGDVLVRIADGVTGGLFDAAEAAEWAVASGGGGGAVASVNGKTGAVVLSAADVGAQPAGSYATAAQGAKADTAVQPGSLAAVATSGSYTDLTNKPTIPAAYTDEQAQDAIAAAFAAGTQTGITVAYNDTTNSLSLTATGTTSPDATTTSKGIVELAGDLSGTAAAPTVTGGTHHGHTASQISDSSTVGRSVLTAADAPTARTALGAGTSNLAVGTTATDAKPGNYTPLIPDLPADDLVRKVQNGDGTWPNRPTARTDVGCLWVMIVPGSADPAVVTAPAVNGMYSGDVVVRV